ncbi:hypothetical protein V6N11_037134 [Hibiscus sabdariffa]|uniref:Cation/H+ exchanger domain-containing protein n=1 Tax=Hibiscus sabdariffa TaxID=183260 RepID=A0ABR2P0M4_9ROSI
MENGARPMSGTLGKYNIVGGLENEFNVCFVQNRTLGLTEWQATSPLMKFLPGFMLQLTLIMALSRLLMTILKPIRQPRFVSEILAGVLLGPTLMHGTEWLALYIHPFDKTLLLETMGSLGVTFYMFLAGLEMDLTPIRKMEKTAYSVAIVGIILPGCGGMILYHLVRNDRKDAPKEGGIFWAITLSITSLPDLAQILSKLKLLSTDLGKTAMTSAVLTDLVSWILLAATVAVVNGQGDYLRIVPTLIFVLVCWGSLLRVSHRVMWRASHVRSFHVRTDDTQRRVGTKIMDKIEEFVAGILLPPVFLVAGLRTNIVYISAGYQYGLVATVIIVASLIKILSTLLVCTCLKFSFRDSLALGVLMNTKGVIAIIVLHEGRNLKGFDQQTFTWMVVSILIMACLVGPVVSFTHKSTRHLKQHHRMNLERSKPESELRVLACLHSSKNLSGLINLLHLSNATRKSPIVVFAVYLVELTGRASALLIFHDKSETNDLSAHPTREIARAFESLQNENRAVTVHPLTAVSPYATMHEDVSNFAVDKNVAVILLPYHKKPNGIGGWEDQNLEHKKVSQNLLASAPCSIGILVDRGLTRHLPLESQHDRIRNIRIAMLFVEGSDDREALTYSWRMAGNPRVTLTVVRFVPGKELLESVADDDPETLSAMFENEKEKLLDDDYINEFRFRTMHNQSITYMEKPVNGGDQIVSTITSAHNDYDLYIVGRGYDRQSPLTTGLSDWIEFPEIGLIGDTLVSVDSLMSASVLVMQQSTPVAALIDTSVSQNSISSASNKGLFSDQRNA